MLIYLLSSCFRVFAQIVSPPRFFNIFRCRLRQWFRYLISMLSMKRFLKIFVENFDLIFLNPPRPDPLSIHNNGFMQTFGDRIFGTHDVA